MTSHVRACSWLLIAVASCSGSRARATQPAPSTDETTASTQAAGPPSEAPSSEAPAAMDPAPAADPTEAEPASDDDAPREARKRPPASRDGKAPAGDAAAFVAAHNAVRAQHCAAPLAWSPKLAAVAQKWADHLRDAGCAFEHSRTDYGENLAAGTEGALDPQGVVDMWYDEIAKYDFRRGGFSMDTGHFTQVVWRATREVGCGRARCKGLTIYVCNYDPAGNYEGQYRDNVRPKGCK